MEQKVLATVNTQVHGPLTLTMNTAGGATTRSVSMQMVGQMIGNMSLEANTAQAFLGRFRVALPINVQPLAAMPPIFWFNSVAKAGLGSVESAFRDEYDVNDLKISDDHLIFNGSASGINYVDFRAEIANDQTNSFWAAAVVPVTVRYKQGMPEAEVIVEPGSSELTSIESATALWSIAEAADPDTEITAIEQSIDSMSVSALDNGLKHQVLNDVEALMTTSIYPSFEA